METKNNIRKSLVSNRKNLDDEFRMEANHLIHINTVKAIEKCQKKCDTDVLLFYYPYGAEVSTLESIEWALAHRFRVGLPKVFGDTMEFFEIKNCDDLVSGAFGILEPKGLEKDRLQEKNAICITPGLGFDRDGNRIGHGRGYYDKFFAMYPTILRIGVAFEAQVVNKIPTDDFDVPMQMVVTEKQIYEIEK